MASTPSSLELAQTLVRMDTCNPPGREEEAAGLCAGLLESAGFAVARHAFAPGRVSVVAELAAPDMESCLCLSGHLDTVPIGPDTWARPPLCGEVAHGRLWGRGSADMKSGVAALVVAALRAATRGPFVKGLRVVLSAGEENGLEGAKYLENLPGVLGGAKAVVVCEPTGCDLLLGHKGVLWVTGEAKGRAAHGSMPEKGENALYKACEAALKLRGTFDGHPGHVIMGRPSISVNIMHAGHKVNVVPDLAEIEMDVRIVPGQGRAAVVSQLSNRCQGLCEVTLRDGYPPVWTEPDNAFARLAAEVAREITGRDHPPAAATYFTDGSVLARAYPGAGVTLFGPGEPEACHSTDESCPVDQIDTAARFYEALALRYLS